MSEEQTYTQEDLEAGRLLFARQWDFLTSVVDMADLPEATGAEIAFAGRSNVGKSSLINALTGRKGLARTSSTPGRTQMLNFFVAPETPLTIVDMPGYGYAQAPKELVEAWTELVFSYLRGRPNLRRVILLIDSRHGLKKNDLETMDLLDRAAVVYQVVLTKSDKIKPTQLTRLIEDTQKALAKRVAAHPEIVATSSEKNKGIDELRAELCLLAQQ
ncbi:MAG: YihA family ribosome biogenesis GTP-binding protein [Roseibium sp.]|uniref:ribosome biogenesis GTP-binding protein YihA/YsxC n=1 Tax=Roseibium sp. TaxID=1936156 RepID=UPI001B005972|nr:ribosome biogenesis GTP-binding protein YihA/YsxC [Roseibium sp.]MBO6509069.1 YihA family ribosome biogenesis GTP-binding protein [Roseibium sp.]MBO6890412.1 YihA family ribosome biogenesis GTP-binding protein [Roseibium sp.]MBO6929147.1 YihA family ribosome biogenesis GTP-binding protein [Roseibium sp.]